MTGSPTYLDAAFLLVALISGLLAMYRGFSREVLSIGSWLAAAGAAAYFILFHKDTARAIDQQFGLGNTEIAQIAVGALIFLFTLIVVHLITSRISDIILDSRIGMIDRILGFLFGIARAFVLIMVPYMGLSAAIENKEQHPTWVRQSWSIQMVEPAGDWLAKFLRTQVESLYSRNNERDG